MQTAINPKFTPISYRNALYRHYVLSEAIKAAAIPGNFPEDFFPTIKRALAELGALEDISIGKLYEYLEEMSPGPLEHLELRTTTHLIWIVLSSPSGVN